MRWIGLFVVALAIAAGVYHMRPAWFLSLTTSSAGPTAPEPLSVRADNHRIFAGGTVEGARREIPLRFEIAGRLKAIHVHEGDRVEGGDVLAELDPEDWKLKLLEAEARLNLARSERERLVNGASKESRSVLKSDVDAAEVHVREAESQLARARQLSQRNSISTQEVEEFRYKHRTWVARLEARRSGRDGNEAPACH